MATSERGMGGWVCISLIVTGPIDLMWEVTLEIDLIPNFTCEMWYSNSWVNTAC